MDTFWRCSGYKMDILLYTFWLYIHGHFRARNPFRTRIKISESGTVLAICKKIRKLAKNFVVGAQFSHFSEETLNCTLTSGKYFSAGWRHCKVCHKR